MKKINLILIFTATMLFLGPWLMKEATFAVTYLDSPAIDYERIENQFPVESQQETTQTPVQQKSRAPEPGTFILFLSGITGFFVRFINKSFEKFKRFTDLLLSTLFLTIAFPILVFAAILIKLNSKGPVIYRQNRVGKAGKIFKIYKLRTMRINAEAGTGAVWARKNDPRITSVGRMLRKSRIDEIPQLINVLRGEMSIVGPRPERPEMVRDFKKLIRDYEKRLQVKPGITGFAQVLHKYDETIQDVKKKIKYDLLYIKKMCLSADLSILGQTIVVVLTGKGAK
jgi:exopolysaccharide biosynthesis polyprenyl glycosylphosphotransferase